MAVSTGSLCDHGRLGSTELAWPWERNPRSSPRTRSLWVTFVEDKFRKSKLDIQSSFSPNLSMVELDISLWRYLALRLVLLLSLATAVTVKEYGLLRYSLASSLLR